MEPLKKSSSPKTLNSKTPTTPKPKPQKPDPELYSLLRGGWNIVTKTKVTIKVTTLIITYNPLKVLIKPYLLSPMILQVRARPTGCGLLGLDLVEGS